MQKLAHKLGDYKLLSKIGEGGMAEVFLAEKEFSHGLSKKLVVKRILPSLKDDENIRKLFIREASILVNVQHPNLVQILDFVKTDGELLLVMEHIDGFSLDQLQASDIGEGLVAHIALQILEGLKSLHEHIDGSILHRDIKPQNIMIDKNGTVKVMDFGIARFIKQDTKGHKTSLRGTLRYTAPERKDGSISGVESDIYSLGILLLDLLSPQNEHSASSEAALANWIASLEADYPRLIKVIQQFVNFDKSKRTNSAALAIRQISAEFSPQNTIMLGRLSEIAKQQTVSQQAIARQTAEIEPSTIKRSANKKAISFLLIAALIAVFVVGGYFVFIENMQNISHKQNQESVTQKIIRGEKSVILQSMLSIDAKRKSLVVIDGKPKGKTPINIYVNAGRHEISITEIKSGVLSKKILYLVPGANKRVRLK